MVIPFIFHLYIYIYLIHIIPCIYPIDYPIYIPFIPFICHLNAIYPRHPSHRPQAPTSGPAGEKQHSLGGAETASDEPLRQSQGTIPRCSQRVVFGN